MSDPALWIEDLSITFAGAQNPAVSGLSLRVEAGEIVGVVGESGSGKSITAFSALRLEPPGAAVSAQRLETVGVDVLKADQQALRALRGGAAAMIFQEPMTALSPTRKIGSQMADVLHAHRKLKQLDALVEAERLLDQMQMRDAKAILQSYSFQLSGGMNQRVLIAMALAAKPRLIIADEITTAIDATVRKAILALLSNRAAEIGAAILFISHDLALVSRFCSRVIVMQAGRVVEEGPAETVIHTPQHPYTQLLRAALPEFGKPGEPLLSVAGGAS